MTHSCTCSSDDDIFNIQTWDIATIATIKLADVNDFIATRDNSIQPGPLKRLKLRQLLCLRILILYMHGAINLKN